MKIETKAMGEFGESFIMNIETSPSDGDVLFIPKTDALGKPIIGISSFAAIGLDSIKKIVINPNILYIDESAFVDCYNLQEVVLNNYPVREINLDKCFVKESNNILFLISSDTKKYYSNVYMYMYYKDIFSTKGIEYIEKEDSITKEKFIVITKLPILEDIYIPDTYLGKRIKFVAGAYNIGVDVSYIKKLRVNKGLFEEDNNDRFYATEMCFSPEETVIHMPKDEELVKVVLFDKVKVFEYPYIEVKNLTYLFIDDSIEVLESFNFDFREKSRWYQSIPRNKYGDVIYKGLLLDYNKNIKRDFEYTLPNETIFMVNGLFRDCRYLEKIKFNHRIKRISDECFKNCERLKELFIPSNVETIGVAAFAELEGLSSSYYSKKVEFEGEEPEIKKDAFGVLEYLPFR